MAWNKTVPTTVTAMVDTPDIYIPNWRHIEETFGVQHHTFTESLSGRHRRGKTPVIFTGPTSAINALSATTVCGSLAFDTTIGNTRVFDGTSTWRLASLWPMTRVMVYRNGDQIIPSGTETTVAFNVESTDILSEYDNSSYVFTPKASGIFYIYSQISFVGVGGIKVEFILRHLTSDDNLKNRLRYLNYTLDTNPITMKVFGVLQFTFGDKLNIAVSHNRSTSCVIEGGSTKSYMRIQRLS